MLKNLTKIQKLMLDWEETCQPRQIDEDEARIKVHKMVSKLGWGYEKVRNLIDSGHGHQECYKAVNRILKRLLLIEKRKPENIPQVLVEELIRGGYLKNDKVPKNDLKAVWQILDRYIVLMGKISVKISQSVINKNVSKQYGKKRRKEINTWIIKLASRELEKFLLPKNKEEVVAKSMYEFIIEQIDVEDNLISGQEKKVQVYIAVQRALYKAEAGILSYYLFKLRCPSWSNCDDDEMDAIAVKIFKIKENIDNQLEHPVGDKLKRICASQVVYFILLFELLDTIGPKGLAKLIKNSAAFKEKITEIIKKTYRRAAKKVRKGLLKSTLYVFITKSVLVEYTLLKGLSISTLELLGILFAGPTLMILVGLSIRKPPEKNTKKIIKVFKRMIYDNKIRTTAYKIKLIGRPIIMSLIFAIFYLVIFTAIILTIYGVLDFYGFSVLTTSVTLFFFSLISYFGFRLREIMREYIVLDRQENIFGFMFDFIALPVLKLGKFLAHLIDILNISKRFFDYILETPFKAFVSFFENWTVFVREKKEELDQGEH